MPRASGGSWDARTGRRWAGEFLQSGREKTGERREDRGPAWATLRSCQRCEMQMAADADAGAACAFVNAHLRHPRICAFFLRRRGCPCWTCAAVGGRTREMPRKRLKVRPGAMSHVPRCASPGASEEDSGTRPHLRTGTGDDHMRKCGVCRGAL